MLLSLGLLKNTIQEISFEKCNSGVIDVVDGLLVQNIEAFAGAQLSAYR